MVSWDNCKGRLASCDMCISSIIIYCSIKLVLVAGMSLFLIHVQLVVYLNSTNVMTHICMILDLVQSNINGQCDAIPGQITKQRRLRDL